MRRQPPFRLILASGSPARRDLLTEAGYPFEVQPANIDEPTSTGFTDARTFVQHVAWLKSAAIARRISVEGDDGASWVLAADTVGWLHGAAIGKPVDEAEARRILRLLSGTEHELWTGVCLWRRPGDLQVAWQEVSRVVMKALTDAEIDTYLRTRQWEGCSGAYAIQGGDDPYVRVVSGSRSNVVGLPMETLEMVLNRLGSARESGL